MRSQPGMRPGLLVAQLASMCVHTEMRAFSRWIRLTSLHELLMAQSDQAQRVPLALAEACCRVSFCVVLKVLRRGEQGSAVTQGTRLRLPVALQMFDARALDFQEKILDRSGLGDETYLPDGECWMLLRLLMSRSDLCTGPMHDPYQHAWSHVESGAFRTL